MLFTSIVSDGIVSQAHAEYVSFNKLTTNAVKGECTRNVGTETKKN